MNNVNSCQFPALRGAWIALLILAIGLLSAIARADEPSAPDGASDFWPRTAYLHETFTGPQPNALFGRAVDLSGDLLVAGAPFADFSIEGNNAIDSGRVRVYRKSGGIWQLEATLVSPLGPQNNAGFGWAVTVADSPVEVIAIGEPYRDNDTERGNAADAGALFIYEFFDGQWQLVKTVESLATDSEFGYSLDVDGDYLLIGLPGYNGVGATSTYNRGGTHAWFPAFFASEPPSVLVAGARFGHSVAIAQADYALIGAPRNSVGAFATAGTAHIRNLRSQGPLASTITLNDPTPQNLESFGGAVAAGGQLFVVGSALDDEPAGVADSGAAHVFVLNQGAVSSTDTVRSPAPQTGAAFGSALALSGASLIVGERLRDTFLLGSQPDAGAAHLYRRNAFLGFWLHDASVYSFIDGQYLGFDVAFSGLQFAAGVPGATVSGDLNAGAVALYQPDLIFADDFEN